MKEKFLIQLQKITSNIPPQEMLRIQHDCYADFKKKPEFASYMVENDFSSFVSNFIQNLKEDQKKKFKIFATSKFEQISDVFELKTNLMKLVTNDLETEENEVFVMKFSLFFLIGKSVIGSYCTKEVMMAKIKFSQTEIAKEFEIDNDTLSRWFELIYDKNIYFGRKQITLGEYFQIFKDLFLEPDEDFNLDENIEKFSKRVLIGKTYTKREIIDFGFELDEAPKNMHFLEASKILNKRFTFYDTYDKYPYSIAIQMINFLKEN